MSAQRPAMLAALAALAIPHTASADASDLRLRARVVRSTEGLPSLVVTAANPSRLGMCLLYLPGPSNISATRNGKELPRGEGIQVRPAMGCYRIPAEADLTFDVELGDLYPQGLQRGTRVCTHVIWRYATQGKVMTNDEQGLKVCAVTR